MIRNKHYSPIAGPFVLLHSPGTGDSEARRQAHALPAAAVRPSLSLRRSPRTLRHSVGALGSALTQVASRDLRHRRPRLRCRILRQISISTRTKA